MREIVSSGIVHDVLFDKDVEGNEAARGEQALWRAVITQALMDAGNDSAKPEMRYEKAQAIAWLGSNHQDFHTVCALAELEPSYVRRKAREALRRGCNWRAEMHRKDRGKISGPKLETKAATCGQVIPFRAHS